MNKMLLLFSLLVAFSCSDKKNEDSSDPKDLGDFSTFIDAKNMRIFDRNGVSESFLNNVGKSYEAMFKDGSSIDQAMRSHYLLTTKDEYVFQRVGVYSENNPNFDAGTPPKPYDDNATDYIWELKVGGKEQIGEVVEHLLHTITNVILYLAYPNDWDYNKSSSALSKAMQEAIDKDIYNISSYDEIKNDKDIYNKILTQEYAYWLVLAEWDYFTIAGKKMDGISGNDEFSIGTSSEIATELPLGHKLYKDYIEKILSIPDSDTIISFFPN